MQPTLVVEPNVAAQRAMQLLLRIEFLAIELLALHRVEERLHVRVVVHLAGPIHALHHPEALQLAPELEVRELDAAIAVEQHARANAPALGRTPQGFSGERRIAPATEAPAHDPA